MIRSSVRPRAPDSHILDSVVHAQKQRRESERNHALQQVVRALNDAPIYLQEAYLFGSILVPGAFGAQSDVDIAIHETEPRTYFRLKSYLEHTIGREVDLIELERCRFADSILRKGRLWRNPSTSCSSQK